jgi:hypothetical protein
MLRAGIQTGDLFPGDFGLIEAFAGNGADEIREAMARVNPNTFCYSRVTRKPGINQGPVEQGMNVRFDWYLGPTQQNSGDPEYRPAPNVLKGLTPNGNACNINNNSQSAQTIPMPRDNCFMTTPGGNCTMVNGVEKVGDGNWARLAYWNQNHPGEPLPTTTINGVSYIDASSPIGGWTRYQTYRYELDNHVVGPPVDPVDESGGPACYSGAIAPSTDPDLDRRVVTAAVVNCVADANRLNGSGVPAKIYAKLFLPEPVSLVAWDNQSRAGLTWNPTPNNSIWVEMIGIVPPNDEVLHVYPVLYR